MTEPKNGKAQRLGIPAVLGDRPPTPPVVAVLGNYPPRRCGIATFTHDLCNALKVAAPDIELIIAAMNGRDGQCYGANVRHIVRHDALDDYDALACALNGAEIDLLLIQHEFGIFGGAAGDHLIALLEKVKAPIVTTLHTVLEAPTDDQRRVVTALIRHSARLVVMTERGKRILVERYNAPEQKIAVVPHGTPDWPLEATAPYKQGLGLKDRKVLLTFGLISPNKGLESVIRALPAIAQSHPDILYVIAGVTHPQLLQHEGERYRERLQALIEDLGVAHLVRFHNHYSDDKQVHDFLGAADIYVTPYLNEAQIVSGTLSFAIAMGKPIVSTPYWHAVDALSDDVGVLVNFNNADEISAAVSQLLGDDARRSDIRKRTYRRGRESTWPEIARRYLDIFAVVADRARCVAQPRRSAPRSVNLSALLSMTNQRGLFQHAIGASPDRDHGYCIDDNARALLLIQNLRDLGAERPELDRLERIYAAFVQDAWNPDLGTFRNFMSFDGLWLEPAGSEDSFGRTLLSLAAAAHNKRRQVSNWAHDLLLSALPRVHALRSPRAIAFCSLAGACLAAHNPSDEAAIELMRSGAERLRGMYSRAAKPGWDWFEHVLAYDNARLPEALLKVGRIAHDPLCIEIGLRALDWLVALQSSPEGVFAPVGNGSFGRPYSYPARHDQQALEAAATIDACWAAYDVTADPRWMIEAQRAYGWFFGANTSAVALATDEGGCRDGLSPMGVNINMGAESILALQSSNCAMQARMTDTYAQRTARRGEQQDGTPSVLRGKAVL